MLTLNRPNRQAIATGALVVISIVPTIYVAWTAWRINRTAHVREVESELGRQLGLRVTLEAVRHPRPGEDSLRGVVLRPEESRGRQATEVARAAVVRLRRSGHDLALEVEGLRLSAESPKQAMAQVSALLQRVGDGLYRRVSLTARDCEIELGQGAGALPSLFRFRDVVGTFEASPTAPTLTVSYRVPGEGSSTRCELSLTRDRQGPDVRTTLVFKSMEGLPLPARVLDPFFDTSNWLGRSARAEGSLTLRQSGTSEWEAEFQGTLLDVDLAALVDRRFRDHRLTGLARIKISQARWADRPGGQGVGWVKADGELSAGPGTIGMGLVKALRSEMKFRFPTGLDGRATDLPYYSLGLTFAMTPDGELRLGGGLGSEYPPAAVLVDANHFTPLASAPEGAANVRGLVRTLFPTSAADRETLVPDTAESRVLQYLPAPITAAKRRDILTN